MLFLFHTSARELLAFFDYAELQAMEQHPMTMQEWINELDLVLSNNRRPLLERSGSISHQQAQKKQNTNMRSIGSER